MTPEGGPQTKSEFDELVNNPPAGCEAVAALFKESQQRYEEQDHQPAGIFVDMTAWSMGDDVASRNLRTKDLSKSLNVLGFEELRWIGQAILDYVQNPNDVASYIRKVLSAHPAAIFTQSR